MPEMNYDKLWEFLNSSDEEFFDKYLVNLADEEMDEFLKKNPDFLRD